MTEKDKERVRETLWAATDDEAKYLHEYLKQKAKWRKQEERQTRQ